MDTVTERGIRATHSLLKSPGNVTRPVGTPLIAHFRQFVVHLTFALTAHPNDLFLNAAQFFLS